MSLLLALTGGGGVAVTHTTTGALTGQLGTIAGAAARVAGSVTHDTTGALTGQLGSVAGSANRFRAFSSSGVLLGQIGSITGSASRSAGAVTHGTSGALVGQSAGISGSAARFRALTSSGVLVGQIGSITGTASRAATTVTHSTTGSLVGSGALLSGVAQNGVLLQDTHDGFWHKQWEKLHKKKPKLEEVIELVQERPATALAEVKEAVKREYPKVDYTQVLNNVELQRFIAQQILINLELRIIAEDEDDIEIMMLL